jgi:uncharacterized membrane protein
LKRFKIPPSSLKGRTRMNFSLAIFSVGFLTAILGALMVYLSLRRGSEDLTYVRFGFLIKPLEKAQESKRLVKFVFFLGVVVTLTLFVGTLMGYLKW